MAPGNHSRPIPLPPLLTLGGVIPLVARRDSWRVLADTWAASAGAARRVVLVPGEAGTGKTRLLSEFARSVHGRGAAVLYGTCSEEQSVPYQPFAEALEQVLSVVDPAVLSRRCGPDASELARLVPRRAAELGLPEPVGHGDPDAERARLFRAVIVAITEVARDRRLLIVLDDLHWAGRPTIDLLNQLVRDQTLTNVMILGSYRSTPADTGEALRSVLPELRRLPGVARLPLSGLDLGGVEDFVAAAAGHPVSSDLRPVVDVLARQTAGNTFLLVELWLHLIDTGHVVFRPDGRWTVAGSLIDIASPEGVREVVAARLARLDEPARQLLEVAAVIGAAFEPSVLAAAAGTSVGVALSTLDVAVQSRIVGEDGAGTFRFDHELIRRSIYDGLSSSARRRRHLGIAQALDGVEGASAELARHLIAAVPLIDARQAVAAALRAAAAAAAAVAYEDAARFLEAALSVATEGRADLLLQVADVTMRAGDVAAAKGRCLEAHDLAWRTGDTPLRIAAALAYSETTWRDVRDAASAACLLRGVLPVAGDEATRVRLQAALTRALALAGEGDAAWMLGEDALASARAIDDAVVQRLAFDALSFAPWTPQTLARQLAVAEESAAAARVSGDLEWELLATDKLLYGRITAGDLDGARATAERAAGLVSRSGQPLFRVLLLQSNGLVAMGEGRFGDAERVAAEADELTRSLSGAPPGGYGVQMFSIRREQNRLEEARPMVEAVAKLGQSRSAWRPALAVMYAELGLLDEAAAEVSFLTADRLAAVPRDALWAGSLSYLADACRMLGDHQAAAVVYGELVGWRGLVVQVGYLLAAHGAADRYLGELAMLLGWEREAEIHLEAALRLDAAAGMPVWLAHSQLAYGRLLAERARDTDVTRATELLDCAISTADRLDMPGVAAAARAARATLGGGSADVDGLTEREVAVVGLVAEGCSNREIGRRLHISQHTAANHVRSILMKTACANRTEAAAWALRKGLPAGH